MIKSIYLSIIYGHSSRVGGMWSSRVGGMWSSRVGGMWSSRVGYVFTIH